MCILIERIKLLQVITNLYLNQKIPQYPEGFDIMKKEIKLISYGNATLF